MSDAEAYSSRVRSLRRSLRTTISDGGHMTILHGATGREPSYKTKKKSPRSIDSSQSAADFAHCSEEATVDLSSDQFVPSISVQEETAYYTHLNLNAKTVVLAHPKIIAIADNRFKDRKLKECYRAIVKIEGVLLCSCSDAQEASLVNPSFQMNVEPCVHTSYIHGTKFASIVLDWFSDDHSYGDSPFSDSAANVFLLTDNKVLVLKDEKFGCVYSKDGRLQCSCCLASTTCHFTKEVLGALQADVHGHLSSLKDSLELPKTITYKSNRVSISWKSVSFTDTSGQSVHCANMESKYCDKCGFEPSVSQQTSVICYDLFQTSQIVVSTFVCPACNRLVQPDGGESGLLNMGDFIATHRLLRDYLKLFLLDGLTLHGFHRKLCWTLMEKTQQVPSNFRIRVAWDSFCRLLPTEKYFSCPVCGPSPSLIIMDGLTLGFKRIYRLPSAADEENTSTLSGCQSEDTLIIKSKLVRQEMAMLCSPRNIDQVAMEKFKDLISGEMPCLPGVSFCEAEHFPNHWKFFLSALSKHSPAAGVQCDGGKLQQAIDDFVTLRGGEQLLSIRTLCPMLYKFFKEANSNDLVWIQPIVNIIIDKLRYMQSFEPHDLPPNANESVRSGHFPSLPEIASRSRYSYDGKKSQSTGCSKYGKQQKNLLHGVFLLHCGHGVCYGFQMMDDHESANTAFSVIRTRFMSAPKVIIYDNGCNPHKYSMYRDPGFFCNTRFFVDRFHWKNHTACPTGYNISTYPEYSDINSQVAEQRNSVLNKLKASLSYMHEENFFQHLTAFLSFRNALNILKNRDAESDDERLMKQI